MFPKRSLLIVSLLIYGSSFIVGGCKKPIVSENDIPTYSKKQNQALTTFWNTQRAGANFFNRHPSQERFFAAKKADIEFVRLAPNKWEPAEKDYLLGNADSFQTIPPKDLQQLKKVLDDAHMNGLKVTLVTLSLPGARWRQHNNGETDSRLWQEEQYLAQSVQFWKQLATELKDHPAIVAYNIINEPQPKRAVASAKSSDTQYSEKETSLDLNRFNRTLVAAIRSVDPDVFIVLDAGNEASASAFSALTPLEDERILYSFHMYEPWEYTTWRKNQGQTAYGDSKWNRKTLEKYIASVDEWQSVYNIPSTRILLGEFGCDRRIPGTAQYLADVIALANERDWHWAFYAFQEDTWDGMDYELGTTPIPWELREARDRGESVELPRKMNPLFAAIYEGIQAVKAKR